MKENTKERLKVALIKDVLADEVQKRLDLVLENEPASAEDAEELLAQLNPSLNAELEEALANGLAGDKAGAAGKLIASKLNGIVAVLSGKATSSEGTPTIPGVQASFVGQVAGMTSDVAITANNPGVAGNSVVLEFDGETTIDQAIDAWNLANPSVTIALGEDDGSQTPDDGEEIQLADGADEIPGTPGDEEALDAAKEAMGEGSIDPVTKDALDIALADEAAGDDLASELKAAVDFLQEI